MKVVNEEMSQPNCKHKHKAWRRKIDKLAKLLLSWKEQEIINRWWSFE